MKKKAVSLLLALCLTLGLLPAAAKAQETLTIATAAELKSFRDSVNSGNSYAGKTVVLTADLDLSGENWTPIGNGTTAFQGVFDGGFHTIRHLTIQTTSRYCGLFGKLENAVIENLGIEHAQISSSANDAAALAGNAKGGRISRCYVTGTVAGRGAVSGILGSTHSSSYTTEIENCYARIAITENGTYTKDLAGISGWNEATSVKITNSYSACTGEKRPIAGWSDGSAVQTGQFVSTYFDKTLSPNFSAEAGRADLGRTSDELKVQSTYAGWDFSAIWTVSPDKNGGYPYLRGFTPGLGGAPGSVTVRVVDSQSGPVAGASVTIRSGDVSLPLSHEGGGVYSGVAITQDTAYDVYVNGTKAGTVTQNGSAAASVTVTAPEGGAQPDPDTYTVLFDINGATSGANYTQTPSKNGSYAVEISLEKPAGIVKEGYTFMGWSNKANYAQLVRPGSNTPHWESYQYDCGDGNGQVIFHSVAGSAKPSLKTSVHSDTTFYAVWAENVLDVDGDGRGDAPILRLAGRIAAKGATIRPLKDYTDLSELEVEEGGTVTVHLNGKRIAGGGIYLPGGGSVTVTGSGTLDGSLLAAAGEVRLTGNVELTGMIQQSGSSRLTVEDGVSIGLLQYYDTTDSPFTGSTLFQGGIFQGLSGSGEPLLDGIGIFYLTDRLTEAETRAKLEGMLGAGKKFSAEGAALPSQEEGLVYFTFPGPVRIVGGGTEPEKTYEISGAVTDHAHRAAAGATVTLMQGNRQIGQSVLTDSQGNYRFTGVRPGLYNVVAEKDSATKTILVTIAGQSAANQNIAMPDGLKNSVVEVRGQTPAVVVGGVDAIAEAEAVSSGEAVTVKLTVERKEAPADKAAIDAAAQGRTVGLYLDLTLVRTVTRSGGSTDTAVTDTQGRVLEIVVPYEFAGKQGITVYRRHGADAASALAEANTGAGGTFRLDAANGLIHIYATKFSTYAIAYTAARRTYTLTVSGGTGSGSYEAGATVHISADVPGGQQFAGWTGAAVADAGSASTTLTMPARDTAVSALFSYPAISGGGDGGWSDEAVYAVDTPSVDGGAIAASPKRAARGAAVTLTLTPDPGYETGGVTVTGQNGREIAVTARGDGRYSFVMPDGKVTVHAVFISAADERGACSQDSACPIWPYIDASTEAWYHDGVHYCIENGLMDGYGDRRFGPNDPLSRAQFAQILFNREGRPAAADSTGFEDVPGGAWYADAVRWAAARGVVGGYGGGRFGPEDPITREQLAVMLWRYAGRPAASGGALRFSDADKISGYAREALCWAVERGVVSGHGGGLLDPQGQATRAQAAQMLKNCIAG